MSTRLDPLSLPQLEDDLQSLLTAWERESPAGFPAWANFHLIREIQAERGVRDFQAARLLVRQMLAHMQAEGSDLAEILTLRYLDGESVLKINRRYDWSTATTYRKQNAAIAQLAHLIREAELAARHLAASAIQARLPHLPHQPLFGAEDALAQLTELLHHPESRLILVGGIGGIGKTTLAHALLQQEFHARRFMDFGWVSAQQRAFEVTDSRLPSSRPALTAGALIEILAAQLVPGHTFYSSAQAAQALADRLRQIPHLIVVDNLETVIDVESLLPTLDRLAGPSKFLLTSRETLRDHPGLHHFLIPELAEADALALIRYEARLHNLPQAAQASAAELAPLYAAVGGNPLALRLVTGQLHLLSMEQVIENLHEARGRSAEALYFYIYRQAWERLSLDDQATLMLMPLFASSGAELPTLSRISDLGQGELVASLQNLARLNLVNVAGDLHGRRFSIHRLTESFLRKEIIRWQEAEMGPALP